MIDSRAANLLKTGKFNSVKKSLHLQLDETVIEGMERQHAPFIAELKQQIAGRVVPSSRLKALSQPKHMNNTPTHGRITFNDEIQFLEKLIMRKDDVKKLHTAFTRMAIK